MWYSKVEYYGSRRMVEDLRNIICVLIGLYDTGKKLVKTWVNLHFIDLSEEMGKMLRCVNTLRVPSSCSSKGFFFDGRAEILRWSEINPAAYSRREETVHWLHY